ncbi:MAG: threonine synthase, partial [Arcobacteraceae bacterium]|nr:threonine synthase [Arcobacteraceae bacterium]
SNENNILTQWINDGVYDIRGKELILTKSPAMDILKSSNIERVLFDLFGAVRTKELMDNLNEKQIFTLTQDEKSKIQSIFSAVYSNDAYGLDKIKEYMNNNYLMDPHTATCLKAYETLKTKPLKAVMYSTAEWTKFSPTVLNAIKQNQERYHDKEALQEIAQICDTKITKSVQDLFGSTVIHKNVIDKENIEKEIINFIQN